ncbi:hypothetical protein [Isoptericola dokdonensis]|uniref:Uncharacterized protein n=1 Tax=Isoptericola dokdonensis DS-3 TaxID=1300344 RepID=A0A161HZC0_9MICO|nr:hypothetical protein [Isoptericola dokdonensis]ANC30045.1 hypothetical protein I598_0458 [Isoptericola dokdonensis DS-3]
MPTLREVAAELYALGPGELVAARDVRARELRSHDEDLVRRVKALRKPSTAAWVVNLLARSDPGQVEQVVELGAAFRAAQSDLDGPRLRELTTQRRRLTAAVTARACELAADQGVSVSGAVTAQVTSTITAAMIDDDAGRAVRSGLLVTALQATGIGRADVAGSVAVPDELGIADVKDDRPRHLHAVPDPPSSRRSARSRGRTRDDTAGEAAARALAEARRALVDAEEDVTAAEAASSAAGAEADRLDAVTRRLDEERTALRRRLAVLEGEAESADGERRAAERVRRRAERTLADAVRRRDEAADLVRDREQG